MSTPRLQAEVGAAKRKFDIVRRTPTPGAATSVAFAEVAAKLVTEMQRTFDEQLAKHSSGRVSLGAVAAYRAQVEHDIAIVRSAAMRKAFQGTALLAKRHAPAVTKALRRVVATLAEIERFLGYCRDIVNPRTGAIVQRRDIADALKRGEQLAEKRTRALEHITAAVALLTDIRDLEYAGELRALAERWGRGKHGTFEEWITSTTAERPSSRGKAAHDRDGAARQWAVRALAERIPRDAPRRFTAIAELLEQIGLDISATSVRTTLTRPRD